MQTYLSAFQDKIKPYSKQEQERILKALARAPLVVDASPRRALEVAAILIALDLDADTIIAAILSVQTSAASDTSKAIAVMQTEFGQPIALLVEGLVRIAEISATNKTIHEAENIRKMLFAMAKDIRVIFIKLADKLVELRDLDRLPEVMPPPPKTQSPKETAQACLDIYAPLADRLGMSWIKDELEDLALKQLNRDAYQQIKEIVALKRGARDEFLNTIKAAIVKEAERARLNIQVSTRAKHFYSIYQKMRKRNKQAGELYDLFGVRILCATKEDCYALFGLVHRLWKPIEGRFKDYIAMPKSNGYQSLHTTVMTAGEEGGEQGNLLEIQIRTWEMHHVAENGIASHWLYKKGSTHELVRPLDISIINRLREWRQSENETGENWTSASFLETIKHEMLKDSIYVFTPQGKVIELPAGATAVDFAYSIHSAIGEHCIGAKADGSIIPLSLELQNTQVVEILTSQNATPHLNWLAFVKTGKAKSKIRSWLQQHDVTLGSKVSDTTIAHAQARDGARGSVHDGGEKVSDTAPKVSDTMPAPSELQSFRYTAAPREAFLRVRVQDEKNMLIQFARCCAPVNGDSIVGYVSRGRGIIIHRTNCPNLSNINDFEERKIAVEWEEDALVKRFRVESRFSPDLFAEIEGAIKKQQGRLLDGRLEGDATERLSGLFTVRLERSQDMKLVMKHIRAIPSVLNIQAL